MKWFNIGKHFNQSDGERTNAEMEYLAPTFAQHQRVYIFCARYGKNKRVLDVGCGSGAGTFVIASKAKEIIGIDNDEKAIKYAIKHYKKNNIKFKLENILRIKKEQFDLVVSLQVIEHMRYVKKYLENIVLLIKPDGKVILSTPNKTTQSYNENPYHYYEYSAKELKKLLSEYFTSVKLYCLHGNSQVMFFEKLRKEKITKIMSIDIFKVRKILPRKIKILLSILFAYIVRSRILKKEQDEFPKISTNSFFINKSTKNAIDLIAVCEK